MVSILIITHGEFGAYLLEAAEEIVGSNPNCSIQSLSISRRMPLVDVRLRIDKALKAAAEASKESGVLVICDMLGGTPCNETLLISRKLERVEVLTGVNLYMVVSAMMNTKKLPLAELVAKVSEDGKRSVANACELLRVRKS